jgi:hypothetical protein
LIEFIEVFGQRFIGLIDDQNVYTTYRVPYPEAPYPQDYIIDQQGIVRYWSDEYDPQEIMSVIDGLLNTTLEEQVEGILGFSGPSVTVIPNPSRGAVTISLEGLKGITEIIVHDAIGRCVHAERGHFPGMKGLSLDLPAGCYIITVRYDGGRYSHRLIVTK